MGINRILLHAAFGRALWGGALGLQDQAVKAGILLHAAFGRALPQPGGEQ